MKRNINITNDLVNASIPNSLSVDIKNLDSLVNHSIDSIVCPVLEYIKESELQLFMQTMLMKLREEAIINIRFMNFKKIFIDYVNQQIPSFDIFESLENKKNILSLDKIIGILNQNNFTILKIDQENNSFIVMAKRLSNR